MYMTILKIKKWQGNNRKAKRAIMKKIKYYLNYSLRLILKDEDSGPEDVEVVELYSGNTGNEK